MYIYKESENNPRQVEKYMQSDNVGFLDMDKTTETEPVYGWNGKLYLTEDDIPSRNTDEFNEYLVRSLSEYRRSFEKEIVRFESLSSFCDNESVNGLSECINHLMDNGGEGQISWDGPDGPSLAEISSLQEIRNLVVSLRQKSRLAELDVLEKHTLTPYTDDSWKDDFDIYMED